MKQHFPLEQFHGVRTPFYFYDLPLLQQTLDVMQTAIADSPYFHVHYAVKANANEEILRFLHKANLGCDCVSGGEVQAALDAGYAPDKIVFAGVGKADWEIELALQAGIFCFNVESEAELLIIQSIAQAMNKKAPVAIRVNPNVDAHTHHYITTGLNENKFGVSLSQLPQVVALAQSLEHIELLGLHFHIGSQLLDMTPFVTLCERINSLQDTFEQQGINFKHINVGGGLGIDYDHPDQNPIPDFESYFGVFKKHLKLRPHQELHFELGRSIVGQVGSLITRVLYVKQGENKQFVILDAGMTDLIRPALYQAHHDIQNITAATPGEICVYDVVGPVCESSDTFGKQVNLPFTQRGDLVALRSAGAYGQIMASQYNCRPLPQAIYKD